MFKNMKNLIVSIVVCCMTFFLAGCTGGCIGGSNDDMASKKNVVVLVGGTANEASVNISAIKDKIKDVCDTCGTLTVIQIDGDPYLVDQFDIPERPQDISQSKEEQIITEQCSQIEALLTQCVPKTAEMDTLQALQMASRALADCTGEKEVILLNSGLSTQGLIDFTQILLESEQSEEIVSYLTNEEALPDFTGVNIIWSGLGETISPQDDLYDKNRKNLQDDWQAVLEASGADSVTFLSGLSLDKKMDVNLPSVSKVPIVKPASAWNNAEYEFVSEKTVEDVFKYDGDKIQFKPDTDELLTSDSEVLSLFSALIEHMKSHLEYKIVLAGTTANLGYEDGLKTLSLKRAERIKDLMVSAGVSESQICAVGLGYDNELTIKDIDENGNLVESQAKQNRAVFVTNIKSSLAKRILNQ